MNPLFPEKEPAAPKVDVPNIRMLEAAAKYKTGDAELDGALLGVLQNMDATLIKAAEYGVDLPPLGSYLPFSKSELMEDGKVKRAFETMMSDPRATEQGKALEAAPEGALVKLLADDPLARIDVPHFAGQIGARVLEQGEDGGVLSFLVAKP